MTTRRERSSQVRPRPPSTGRVQPTRPKARPSTTTARVNAHSSSRRTSSSPGLPLVKGVMAAGVVALAVVVILTAPSVIGALFGGVGQAFSGVVGKLTQTAEPSASLTALPPAPSLSIPDQPYTNQATLDLTGTIPNSVAGQDGYTIRIYRQVGTSGTPTIVGQAPIGDSPTFTVPNIALASGSNVFTATIADSGGESPPSTAVTYILDQAKPKVTVSSPTKNAVINGATVPITGQTQPGSSISARNQTNAQTAVATADNTGKFTVVVPLAGGQNAISLTVTDPAGNTASVALSVQRGTGALTPTLTASAYHFKASKSNPITMSVVVLDPNGAPLAGATVTFSLTFPGEPPIVSSPLTTSSKGRVTWKTTIPATTAGKGEIVALVQTDAYGQANAQLPLTFN
jgi:Bacterial Ig domain